MQGQPATGAIPDAWNPKVLAERRARPRLTTGPSLSSDLEKAKQAPRREAGAGGLTVEGGLAKAIRAGMQEDLGPVGFQGFPALEGGDLLCVGLGLDEASPSAGEANEEIRIVEAAGVAASQADGPGLARRVPVPPADFAIEGGVLEEANELLLGLVEGEGLVHGGEEMAEAADDKGLGQGGGAPTVEGLGRRHGDAIERAAEARKRKIGRGEQEIGEGDEGLAGAGVAEIGDASGEGVGAACHEGCEEDLKALGGEAEGLDGLVLTEAIAKAVDQAVLEMAKAATKEAMSL